MCASQFVMRGYPAPHNARQGLHKLRRAIFLWLLCLALCLRYAPATRDTVVSPLGVFFSCSLCFFSFFGWFSSRFCLVRLLLLGGLGLLVLWRFVRRLCLRRAVCCVLVRVVRCLVLPVLLVSVIFVVQGSGSSCVVGVCCSLCLFFVVFLWGFPLVRFSFSVRSRSSVRRVSVPFRRVVGLALSRGCCSWLLRSSLRSFSGSVVWCGFASRSRAAAFAFVVSRLVGVVVWVRPGSVWFVSVPVAR